MKESPRANAKAVETLAVATRSSNTTVNGTGVDLSQGGVGYRVALIVVHTGTITDGTHTVEVQESSDNSTFTAVADSDLEGTEPAIGSTDDNDVFEIGYTGSKEFIRVSVTTASATSGGTFGATVVLLQPSAPAAR